MTTFISSLGWHIRDMTGPNRRLATSTLRLSIVCLIATTDTTLDDFRGQLGIDRDLRRASRRLIISAVS
jgi:hypothetical protein